MAKIKKAVRQITETARKPKKKKTTKKKPKTKNIVSTGSTLLNLACTHNPLGGFPKGKYIWLVGDSTSGKTFLSMTCFAEALSNPEFEHYRLIYDNVEDGMNIDLENLFNQKVAEKVEPPKRTPDGAEEHSFSIEEFYYNLDDALNYARVNDAPFIYVLDSMDGLSSEAEVEKFEETKDAHRKGRQTTGSFGDGKAKKNSAGLRKILKGLRETGSILIIISQTRDNLGYGPAGKTSSGGRALKFYATLEIWSKVIGKIKKTVKGKPRTIGVNIELELKKNRPVGKLHKAKMDIYPSYGIDDIGSCIDYLVEEKWWKKSGQTITADEFDMKCTREKLIRHIEDNGLYRKLQIITGRCWMEILEASNPKRKKRYE